MGFIDLSGLFAILVLFAGVATLQFFYGRKLNILIMKNVVDELEQVIKPKDQLYTWLGGYVGFKAEYSIDDPEIEKVEVTLTLLPRQSILYLPISKLTLKGDRLFFVIRCRHAVKGDVHAVKKNVYRFTKPIDSEIEYLKEDVKVGNEEFTVYYKKKDDLKKLIIHLRDLPYQELKHISLTPSTRVIYAFVTPGKEIISRIYPKLLKIARDFTEF